MSERPSHYKVWDQTKILYPGWYKTRSQRYVKLFLGNCPLICGREVFYGGCWDNANQYFYAFGSWSWKGFTLDFTPYFDIIKEAKVPSNFPNRKEEEERIKKFIENEKKIYYLFITKKE